MANTNSDTSPSVPRLDDETERAMAGFYTAVGDADSWAAISLRKRIRVLIAEEVNRAMDQAYGDGSDNVGMIA